MNVSVLDFSVAKDDRGGGNNWSYKTCKAPVKLSPPTNQNPALYTPDALHVTQPTVSEHWRGKVSHSTAFLPAQRIRKCGLCYGNVAGWLTGCLSVTCRYCIKTAKPILKRFLLSDSPIILVCWRLAPISNSKRNPSYPPKWAWIGNF